MEIGDISTRTFKKLQTEWYARLRQEGFCDIESPRPIPTLKTWHASHFGSNSPAHHLRSQCKQAYYEKAKARLYSLPFRNRTYKRVWELHCDGLTHRAIAVRLSTESHITHFQHVKIGYIIREIAEDRDLKVILRAYNPETDSAFILDSWSKRLFHGKKPRPPKSWFREFFNHAKAVLENAKVYVACTEDAPDTITGYSIVKDNILHFVYVKIGYRRVGIGTLLVSNKGIRYLAFITSDTKYLNTEWELYGSKQQQESESSK